MRKLAHYLLFAVGGLVIYWILACFLSKHKTIIAIFLGLLLACADEFHQRYSLNRGPGIFDVGIDTLGIISGVMLAFVIGQLAKKIESKWKKGKKIYDKFQKNNSRQNCKNG